METSRHTWNGAYGPKGSKSGPNKGIMSQYRAAKREEAEERNARTLPENRRAMARAAGYSRNSARKADGV